MEVLMASAIGLLTACGVFLLLRARTFSVALGLTLLSHLCETLSEPTWRPSTTSKISASSRSATICSGRPG